MAWRVVPPASDGIPRVPPYSGSSPLFSVFAYVILTLSDLSSHTIRLTYLRFLLSSTPIIFLQSVWPSPISLATTLGISFDFSSSPYLDVSVQAVPLCTLFFHVHINNVAIIKVSPFGYPWLVAYLQLPTAFRSLSRPSSAPSAQASSLCSS